jgi:hypothetical protein
VTVARGIGRRREAERRDKAEANRAARSERRMIKRLAGLASLRRDLDADTSTAGAKRRRGDP